MEARHSNTEDISPAKAVMLGALAPGVNGPTWNTLKIAFLMLGLCLSAMLGLAFSSSDSMLIFHVTFLVLIAGTLFLLLTRDDCHPPLRTVNGAISSSDKGVFPCLDIKHCC